MSSEETLLAALTAVVALAVLVLSIYDMFRIVQKISQVPAAVSPSVTVGWGLICVLSAAALAMIVSLAAYSSSANTARGPRRGRPTGGLGPRWASNRGGVEFLLGRPRGQLHGGGVRLPVGVGPARC